MLLPNNFSAGKSHVNSEPNETFNEISYNAGPEVFVNNIVDEDRNNNLFKIPKAETNPTLCIPAVDPKPAHIVHVPGADQVTSGGGPRPVMTEST